MKKYNLIKMKTIIILFLSVLIYGNALTQIQVNPDEFTDPFDSYYQKRERLYNLDSLYRMGYNIPLNEKEREANDYLLSLQRDFIDNSKLLFPPALYFYEGRHIIDTSKIYRILKLMPKGGLLHAHFPAAGSVHWLVKEATYKENCYMFTVENNDKNVYGAFMFFNPENVPPGWESLKSLREKDPDLDEKLVKLLTFDLSQFQDPYVWDEFENIFTRMSGLIQYYPVFMEYSYDVIDSLAADNVQHFELRTFFSGVYDLDGKIYTQEECLGLLKEIGENVKKKYPYFTFKTIYCGYRGWDGKQILVELNKALGLRSRHREFMLGFDLVGEEDKGHTTAYFLPEFLKLDSLQNVYGVDLPFYFHDGESTLPGNKNLYDAILLRTKRIGHGINLFRYPALEVLVKEWNIPLEVCPLSNQILGYVENLRMHPASEYINRGIPVTINSDDPQIFGYTGLTYDYWSAFMAWELDLSIMKALALNSLIYSGLSETEKTAALSYFEMQWEKFIEEVLKVKRNR
jgi:adenosine deaminase CECR1